MKKMENIPFHLFILKHLLIYVAAVIEKFAYNLFNFCLSFIGYREAHFATMKPDFYKHKSGDIMQCKSNDYTSGFQQLFIKANLSSL